ncbi:serine carboxypeptidase-like 7 [Corylus avellana]|uniref:serine carboxypeptidase-like 7 n=1 Tax=Corylus avellana TaxID=13451 RepID=UPI00286C7E5B|nr:serine carboxypeptidase-like 7 [Corylus avellana]
MLAMARLSSFFSHSLCFHMILVFLLLLLQVCPELAVSRSTVKYLPGFRGTLPFELETGYVAVGDSEDVQLFYYFVKSERSPKDDPLLLWLIGGPGCSAWTGVAYEIGPLNFKMEEYNGSLPELVLNPHSWTKECSIIFVDSPVGTGFSYGRTPTASQSSDSKQVDHLHQFLVKWLIDHSEFVSNAFYVGGHSFTGITIPILVQRISSGNEEGVRPLINLQGYILGNPMTDPILDGNSVIPSAYGLGFISDELYESLKTTCGGEYVIISPRNAECLNYVQAFYECLSGINFVHVLESSCAFASPKPQVTFDRRRSLYQNLQVFLDPDPSLPPFGCLTYGYLLSRYWANDDGVRKALHTRKGSIGEWERCKFGLRYTHDVQSTFEYHVKLSTEGYRSLIYSGDHDLEVPSLGTQAWIRYLNHSIVDDWRSWIVQGQVAGYTRTYSNRMTFATVKGGGHTAPEYRPEECFIMFKRWISHEAL